MKAEAIAAAHVVKYATADENKDTSIVTIKVAGEEAGHRCRLSDEVETQLEGYLAEIKDAGVRINLVNADADTFNCSVDIYYNAMLLPENVQRACEYTNMALIDTLQGVEGVKIAEFRQATTVAAGAATVTTIDARHVPAAGYFRAGQITLTMKAYERV